MDNLTIKTNHQYRDLYSFYGLSDDMKKDLNTYDGYQESTFFEYKGCVYDLADFVTVQLEPLKEWDGIHNETAFSGVLVKLSDCGDMVKVGRYYS